ncbi:MAG TPA: kelch repeat-containing protein, partial [Terriglobales bacterium]|nr:kelch repeat-containing protein [Terriglobales bacterium]
MGDVRSGAAAVLLQDGKVLISGGSDTTGPNAGADLFDTSGVFTAAAPMNSARSGHTATLLSDGRVLVTGGGTGSGITNSAEVYDPAAGSWTLLSAVMLDARAGHTASLLSDGRVLLAGGHNSGGALSSLEIFDPLNDDFTSAGTLTANRMNHAAAVLGDGRVLVIGGTADGANALATVEIYDPGTGTVSAGPNLSMPRMAATATTTLDGKVAVIGGSSGYATSGSVDLASAEVFDPTTGAFSASASNLATARSGHRAFLLSNNNSILIVGGTSGVADLNSTELYLPWTDSFQTTGAMSVARPGMIGSATGMDGRFLAAGGTNLASTELYGFTTVKTDAADYAPGSTVTITGSGWQPGETVMLTLVESPLIDTHPSMTAIADGNGNILNNQFSPDVHDVNLRFYLTAVGSQSGLQAQNTFTDSVNVHDATITIDKSDCTTAQTSFMQGETVCANTAVNTTGSGASTSLNIVWFAPGAITPTATHPITITGDSIETDMFTLTASSPAGTWTIKACDASNCSTSGGKKVWDTKTFTVAAVSGTATAVTSSANPSAYGQSVTFTATVAPASGSTAPTGTVQFVIDGSNFGAAVTLSPCSPSPHACATVSNSALGVGSHTVSAGYTHTGSFTDSNGSLAGGQTVDKAHLMVTANDQSRAYGASDPTFTYTISGFVNNENLGSSGVSGVASCSTTAISTSTASPPTYPISCTIGTLGAANYDFTPFIAGALTITKIDATIAVTGYSGPYTATAHGATGTATGLLAADLNSLLHVAATTYTDVPGGLVHWTFDGNTNYNSASGDATVTITKIDATIAVTGYSGPYTATAHGATGTATG